MNNNFSKTMAQRCRERAAIRRMEGDLLDAELFDEAANVLSDPSEYAPFVHVGNVFGKDNEGDVLVDWESQTYEPAIGTILYVRLYTQAELDAAHAYTEERIGGVYR